MFGTFVYHTGLKYIYATLFIGIISFKFSIVAGITLLLLSLGLVLFFRHPYRAVPYIEDKQIISPADGVVLKIVENAQPPKGYEYIEQTWKQVSIFMRVSDVHINRYPITGTVKQVHRVKGLFKYAAADTADIDNERVNILIEGKITVICQQVAGMLARRIICRADVNDAAVAGNEYGMIQLGSRADLFIPNDLVVDVKVGQTVYAGLTFIVK